jgi:hypothetical protein
MLFFLFINIFCINFLLLFFCKHFIITLNKNELLIEKVKVKYLFVNILYFIFIIKQIIIVMC